MTPGKEVLQSYAQMAVVEKYETVIAYLYPVAQNIGRRHGVAKAMFIECRFVAAWRGHAAHADTCNLFNYLENSHGIHCH